MSEKITVLNELKLDQAPCALTYILQEWVQIYQLFNQQIHRGQLNKELIIYFNQIKKTFLEKHNQDQKTDSVPGIINSEIFFPRFKVSVVKISNRNINFDFPVEIFRLEALNSEPFLFQLLKRLKRLPTLSWDIFLRNLHQLRIEQMVELDEDEYRILQALVLPISTKHLLGVPSLAEIQTILGASEKKVPSLASLHRKRERLLTLSVIQPQISLNWGILGLIPQPLIVSDDQSITYRTHLQYAIWKQELNTNSTLWIVCLPSKLHIVNTLPFNQRILFCNLNLLKPKWKHPLETKSSSNPTPQLLQRYTETPKKRQFRESDLLLLTDLQRVPYCSHKTRAQHLNMNSGSIAGRLSALKQHGFYQSYLWFEYLGLGVTFYIYVVGSSNTINEIVERISVFPLADLYLGKKQVFGRLNVPKEWGGSILSHLDYLSQQNGIEASYTGRMNDGNTLTLPLSKLWDSKTEKWVI
ncbi:MAG: hypothetical protein ACFFC7_06600 [Candidatus Hermodarchaeota archaeon]